MDEAIAVALDAQLVKLGALLDSALREFRSAHVSASRLLGSTASIRQDDGGADELGGQDLNKKNLQLNSKIAQEVWGNDKEDECWLPQTHHDIPRHGLDLSALESTLVVKTPLAIRSCENIAELSLCSVKSPTARPKLVLRDNSDRNANGISDSTCLGTGPNSVDAEDIRSMRSSSKETHLTSRCSSKERKSERIGSVRKDQADIEKSYESVGAICKIISEPTLTHVVSSRPAARPAPLDEEARDLALIEWFERLDGRCLSPHKNAAKKCIISAKRVSEIITYMYGQENDPGVTAIQQVINDFWIQCYGSNTISSERETSSAEEGIRPSPTLYKLHSRSSFSDKAPSEGTSGVSKKGLFAERSSSSASSLKECHLIDVNVFLAIAKWRWNPSRDNVHIVIIRDALLNHCIDHLVAEHANIKLSPNLPTTGDNRLIVGDLLVSTVICINAITIGINTDVDWVGFEILELFFVLFFAFEFIVKFASNGWRNYFLGRDFAWNMFDLVILLIATADIALSSFLTREQADMREITMARLVRVARITRLMRLLRLLRLKVFKELLAMIKGVESGLRTLFWAIVLLFCVVYAIAVILRQTIGGEKIKLGDQHETTLFPSLTWSMFVTFNLFIGEGDLPDGTPLIHHLYNYYGGLFTIPYSLCLMFILFGIFNMVTAIFVENVMEASQMKKEIEEESERYRVTSKLRLLVHKFSGCDRLRKSRSSRRLESGRDSWGIDEQGLETLLRGSFDREQFKSVIDDAEVVQLMDDLDVVSADRSQLFDVLDADNSGTIEVSELVRGFMKMRGLGAEKCDIIATILGVRSLQSMLMEFRRESQLHHEQQLLTLENHGIDRCEAPQRSSIEQGIGRNGCQLAPLTPRRPCTIRASRRLKTM